MLQLIRAPVGAGANVSQLQMTKQIVIETQCGSGCTVDAVLAVGAYGKLSFCITIIHVHHKGHTYMYVKSLDFKIVFKATVLLKCKLLSIIDNHKDLF